jgi:light-regulated signal transduction histidine kinase (bacteriophytochrome)
MSTLIEDLLTLSRLGRASVSRTEVDISALARSVASRLEEAQPERRVEWRIAPNLRAQCDLGLSRIVFENLLGNAWKFTARRPNAVIEVRESDDSPGAIVVIDNGAGFDMQYAGALFRPFQRLHQTQDFPGTGIGLATVQLIVEKHGGSVKATGEVGAGAQVTVSFEA